MIVSATVALALLIGRATVADLGSPTYVARERAMILLPARILRQRSLLSGLTDAALSHSDPEVRWRALLLMRWLEAERSSWYFYTLLYRWS